MSPVSSTYHFQAQVMRRRHGGARPEHDTLTLIPSHQNSPYGTSLAGIILSSPQIGWLPDHEISEPSLSFALKAAWPHPGIQPQILPHDPDFAMNRFVLGFPTSCRWAIHTKFLPNRWLTEIFQPTNMHSGERFMISGTSHF